MVRKIHAETGSTRATVRISSVDRTPNESATRINRGMDGVFPIRVAEICWTERHGLSRKRRTAKPSQ
ncbi:MAG: hypothetical protein R3E12_01230 [Candidatus Eisenbacteria bacterium]